MHATTETACRRLLALILLTLVAWIFACRPAWSPDGKQVVYPSRLGERVVLARYDRTLGTNEVLFEPIKGNDQSVAHFLPDGRGLVVLSSSRDQGRPLTVDVLPLPTGDRKLRRFEIETGESASQFSMLPPVVVGNALFLGGRQLRRIDLDNGKVTAVELEGMDSLVLAARGDGVCYMARHDPQDETSWELGTVDPETLQQRRLFSSPTDEPWRVLPMPVFTRDLGRVALPGLRPTDSEKENAILVFADGKLETTLAIPGEQKAGLGSLCWGPDDVTLYAITLRPSEDGTGIFLLETTFSGSVMRETPLITALPEAEPSPLTGFAFQLAVSPDGGTAAMSTAILDKLDAEQHGLLLIDLKAKDRKVTRIPFPQR